MLVKVSVENFKSFDKAAELTMISSNKIRTFMEQMHLERPIWHCSLNFLKTVSAMVFQ